MGVAYLNTRALGMKNMKTFVFHVFLLPLVHCVNNEEAYTSAVDHINKELNEFLDELNQTVLTKHADQYGNLETIFQCQKRVSRLVESLSGTVSLLI